MNTTEINKTTDIKKPLAVKPNEGFSVKSNAPAWKATFSKRLPHRIGEPLSSSGGGDGSSIQF